MSMRFSLLVATAALAFASSAAVAASPQAAGTGHSLTDCSHANKGKTGAAYKDAVNACMHPGAMAAAPHHMTSQEHMAYCSNKFKGEKGDQYKNDHTACLKEKY